MEDQNEHKAMIGFKCDPSLRVSLSHQADKLGITLSSHIETMLLSQQVKENEIKQLSEKLNRLEERISFYEQNPLLQTLYEKHKGQVASYMDSHNKIIDLKIDSIKDVFTVIVDSFKIDK